MSQIKKRKLSKLLSIETKNSKNLLEENFVEKFDIFIRIENYHRFCPEQSSKKKKRKRENDPTPTDRWKKLLERGLGDRIVSLIERPCEEDVEPFDDLVIGLKLNPDTYHRVIDRGPSANSTEAAEFRELWGDKSEMRKFADGSICETVLWSGKSTMERRRIIESIVKFLLLRHFQIPPDAVTIAQNVIESVLVASPSNSSAILQSTGEENFRSLCECYEKLGGILRSLDGLPLAMTRVQAISPSLRHTEIFPPVSIDRPEINMRNCVFVREECFVPKPKALYAPPWKQSHEVHITLESSGKWPEEIGAIRQLKCAFYLKMRELLKEQFGLKSWAFEDRLLVILNSFIFRLIIIYPREAALLKLKKDERGALVSKNNKESTAYELATTHAEMHSTQMLGVVHAYPSFSLTCRLARRWICCHLLSDFLRPEAIDLLVASLYLELTNIPGSSFAGFLKFLRLLVEHDWLTSPLVVNLNAELSNEDKEQIRTKFISLRPTLPPMCLATPSDLVGSRWTRGQPNPMIFERICQLARASLDILETDAFKLSETIVETIFRPTLDVYDALIWIRDRKVPKSFMSIDRLRKVNKVRDQDRKNKHRKPHRDEIEDRDRFPVVDFDPAEDYLRTLREKFDRYALFFYDSCGGEVIGVLWRPRMTRKEEKEEVDQIEVGKRKTPDISQLLNEFATYGKGFVRKVDDRRNLENVKIEVDSD